MFTVGTIENLVTRNGVGIVQYDTAQGRPNSIAIFKQ